MWTAISISSSIWNWQCPTCCSIFKNQFLYSCCLHITLYSGPTSAIIITDVWLFSNTVHSCYTINTHLLIDDEFQQRKLHTNKQTIPHYKCLHRTKFPMSWPLHNNLCSEQHLTDSCSICCMVSLIHVLPPFSCFHSIMSYGIIFWGNSHYSINIFKIQKRIIQIMTN